jgi:Peptidase A4 family
MRKLGIGFLAAVAVLTGVGAAAGPALAASATRPVIYSAEQAGAAIGAPRVHYRYVETTFTLPNANAIPYSSGGGLSVQLRAADDIFVLGISTVPGSSTWNAAAVDLQPGSCTSSTCIAYSNPNSPGMLSGDTVTLSAYYNTGNGFMYFNATDNTTGSTFAGRFSDQGALFSSARVGAEFADFPAGVPGSAFQTPPADYRLALLTGTKVTQYNGKHVTLLSSSQVIETSNGTSSGTVQLNAPSVTNNGAKVGVWVRS